MIVLFSVCYLCYVHHYLNQNAKQNITSALSELSKIDIKHKQDTKFINLIAKQYISTEIKNIWIEKYLQYFIIIGITTIGLLLSSILYYRALRQWMLPLKHLQKTMQNILQNKEQDIQASNLYELQSIESACFELQNQYSKAILDAQQNIETTTSDLQQSLELLEEKNIELSLEKKKIEEKSKQRSELILNMSHEIRTPINGVVGFTNLLLETDLDPIQKDYVDTIKSSAKDLLEIINEILDYAKMDAEKLKLDNIPIDLRNCVEEVVTLMTPSAQKNAVDLIVITNHDIPKVLIGDPLRIKQILHNLIGNAIKFSPNGKVIIRISLGSDSEKHQNIVISVQDTGLGIDPKDQSTLFQAFHQIETIMTKRYGGSGLGLAICKKLTELMKGNISLKSELNKGSTFTVQIQLEKLQNTNPNIMNSRFSALNIICFDEDALYLESIKNTLTFLGANCKTTSSKKTLKTLISNKTYHLGFIGLTGKHEEIIDMMQNSAFPCFLITKQHIAKETVKNLPLLMMPLSTLKIRNCIESVAYTPNNKTAQNLSAIKELRNALKLIYPSILVVEDHPASLKLIENTLKSLAYIKIANNGYEAIAECENMSFNILIIDYNLPDLNALELIEKINDNNCIIFIMSACIDELKTQKLQSKIVLLEKPVDESVLLTNILQYSGSSKTPEIDWLLCLERVSNNEKFAKNFMRDFIKELKINRSQFLEYLEKQEISNITQLAHKVYGACCFCGVPKLQHYSALLEKQSKNASSITQLEELIQVIVKSIDNILSIYQEDLTCH